MEQSGEHVRRAQQVRPSMYVRMWMGESACASLFSLEYYIACKEDEMSGGYLTHMILAHILEPHPRAAAASWSQNHPPPQILRSNKLRHARRAAARPEELIVLIYNKRYPT